MLVNCTPLQLNTELFPVKHREVATTELRLLEFTNNVLIIFKQAHVPLFREM